MTVWLIILLALFRRHSYLNLLGMLEGSGWATRYWSGRPPPCSTALTKARDRLGVEPLARLYRRSAGEWAEADGGLFFHGRRVCAIDGFTLKTWDSDENRARFGAPGASRGQSAFPQVRMVACLDVGTRVLAAARFGPYAKAEITLAEDLRPDLRPGSLVLLDRGFVAYGFLWDLAQQGNDFLVRGKRNMKVRRIQQLGPGDFLVRVRIPRYLCTLRPELPRTWVLRQIVAEVPGSKGPRRLFTNLLDPKIRGAETRPRSTGLWSCGAAPPSASSRRSTACSSPTTPSVGSWCRAPPRHRRKPSSPSASASRPRSKGCARRSAT
jgi:hypothetical protein